MRKLGWKEEPKSGFSEGGRGPAAGWRASTHSTTVHPPACIQVAKGRLVDGVFTGDRPADPAAPSLTSLVAAESSVISARVMTRLADASSIGAPPPLPATVPHGLAEPGFDNDLRSPQQDGPRPALRLRGGADELDGDIIEDWKTLSSLPLRRRSPALVAVDRALDRWKNGGRPAPDRLGQNERELKDIAEAIDTWWDTNNGRSGRSAAMNRLQEEVRARLADVQARQRAQASRPSASDGVRLRSVEEWLEVWARSGITAALGRAEAQVAAAGSLPERTEVLRGALTAIGDWQQDSLAEDTAGRGPGSDRWRAVETLRAQLQDRLEDLLERPRRVEPMAVASHPADDEANAARGVLDREATQQMVAGTRDLRVARWLLSNDPQQAQTQAQRELARLLRGADHASSTAQTGLRRILQQQADQFEEDVRIYAAMRARSPQVWKRLDEAQAAALVVVERRGRLAADRDYQAAQRRLQREPWAQPYSALDAGKLLRRVHEHLRRGMRLTTNIPVQRIDSLLADPQGRFRNYWETGTTQAAIAPQARLKAEEDLGYAATLGRSRGLGGPSVQDRPLLPKYAALMSRLRPGALSMYGDVVLVWKQQVQARTTFTPRDSMDWPDVVEGARSVTGSDHLYPLLAYGEDDVVRLAFAEATGFAYDPELHHMLAAGATSPGYFEAQIHGDLAWSDLDTIVIRYPEGWQSAAEHDRDRLVAYARQHDNTGLRVELSRIGDPIPNLPAPAASPVQAFRASTASSMANGLSQHIAAVEAPLGALSEPHDIDPALQALRREHAWWNALKWRESSLSGGEACVSIAIIDLGRAGAGR
jgi:hypothetical protein